MCRNVLEFNGTEGGGELLGEQRAEGGLGNPSWGNRGCRCWGLVRSAGCQMPMTPSTELKGPAEGPSGAVVVVGVVNISA